MRTQSCALLLGLIVAGCQAKETPGPPAPPPEPASVTMHASDYAFSAPDTIRAGVTTFYLVNDGPGLHHALLVRLDSGKTAADLFASLKEHKATPPWATYVGGPNVPNPGNQSVATLDVSPGNYVIICILDMPGGVPHYMRGMFRALTVVPGPTTTAAEPKAVAPVPDNAIQLSDRTFEIAKPITPGTHTFQVVIAPGQPHEVLFVQLNAGKTGQDYVNWTKTMKGPAPGYAVGGTSAATSGTVQVVTVTFAPGNYLLICFVPDLQNGKPHYMEGDMLTVTVK